MPANKRYDVMIAGGGPAGSTAGYILSKAGLKVLLIDRNTFPRHKLCGGCITEKAVQLLQRVFGETANGLMEKDIINFGSRRYEIYSRNRLITGRETRLSFYFVERHRYDHFFLEKAREAGAEIREGDGVVSFDVVSCTARAVSGNVFSSRFVIGADGVNSIIRRNLPEEVFDRAEWRRETGNAVEILIDRSELPAAIDHPALYFDFNRNGYAWLFPNREKIVAGIGGLARDNVKVLRPSFMTFLSSLKIKGPERFPLKGCTFPYGNYLTKPVYGNVLLAGDAAGFADPLLGEGIYYAQRSGELAAHAILDSLKETDEQAAQRYVRSLDEHIMTELLYAKKIRDFMFSYLGRMRFLPLKIIMSMLGDMPIEAVHGVRSYRWLKKI